MKAHYLTLIGFLFIINPVFSQEVDSIKQKNDESKSRPHYLGVNAGFTTGIGFSYRYSPSKNAYQVTLLPLYDSKNTYLSFGLGYFREIRKLNEFRFMVYTGSSLQYRSSDIHGYTNNLGAGFGFEFSQNAFSYNLMLGYAAYDMFYSFALLPTIELGVYYRF